MNTILKSALAIGLLAGMTATSQADTLAKAHRTVAQSGTNTDFATILLTNNGTDSLSFNAPVKGFYYFTYNAECTAAGLNGWVSVQIVVDGNKLAHPKAGSEFAFCSGYGGASYTSSVVRGFVQLNPGNHSVEVQASRESGPAGASWRLDDTLLTVEN